MNTSGHLETHFGQPPDDEAIQPLASANCADSVGRSGSFLRIAVDLAANLLMRPANPPKRKAPAPRCATSPTRSATCSGNRARACVYNACGAIAPRVLSRGDPMAGRPWCAGLP